MYAAIRNFEAPKASLANILSKVLLHGLHVTFLSPGSLLLQVRKESICLPPSSHPNKSHRSGFPYFKDLKHLQLAQNPDITSRKLRKAFQLFYHQKRKAVS